MTREEKIDIFNETVELSKKGEYTPNGKDYKIQFTNTEEMKKETKFYFRKPHINFSLVTKYQHTNISIENIDTLECAEGFNKMEEKTAILNMASFSTPGGGVTRGSSAQEESLFRRTNLFQSLYQFHPIGENYGVEQHKLFKYPLDMNFGAIYSPYVTVFRTSEKNGCKLMDNPFLTNVISIAAIKNPPLNENGTIKDWAVKILTNKVEQIFNVAILNNVQNLVLGALGCGAYATPPKEMAKIFYNVINDEKYKNTFKNITFAILEDNNSFKQHNINGNIKPFKEIFQL